MFYRNARIFDSDFQFHHGAFEVRDGRFGQILPEQIPDNAVDLGGATVIPGLIDIHTHGNSGADFSDGADEGLEIMARYYAANGVTSFVPTSMTLPYEALERAFTAAARFTGNKPTDCARLLGIHMEGPFLSCEKCGAQNAAFLRNPDFEAFRNLYDGCRGLIRIVDVAPELPGAIEFIEKASKLCTVSAAHTNADYACAKAAFASGATQLTHLYNAMPPMHHRDPGVIPAAVEQEAVRAEVICDGYHVHPAAVRLAFSMFGAGRMILISDSGRCAGLPEGSHFILGGQEARLQGGVGRLADGTIACSAVNLWDCLKNTIDWGVPEEDAIRAATWNPACAVSAEGVVGSIASGKYADFIVCSPDYKEKRVFLAGRELRSV